MPASALLLGLLAREQALPVFGWSRRAPPVATVLMWPTKRANRAIGAACENAVTALRPSTATARTASIRFIAGTEGPFEVSNRCRDALPPSLASMWPKQPRQDISRPRVGASNQSQFQPLMSSNANPITDPGQPVAALESAGLRLAIVVAATDNGVIGRDGRLPWHLPDDLKRFKSLTLGKPVLMGRKTYESIGKPLVDRPNIVLTRNPGWETPHVIVVHSLAEALKRARPATELMVIGGADIFALCLPLTRRIHLTQ